jgi:alpha/beta superfamily hydrolase
MDNPLICGLASLLATQSMVTLRFDYRGVGTSTGPAVNVAEFMARFWDTGTAPIDGAMLEDGRAALNWMRLQTGAPVVVIGYSFGAYVADTILDDRIADVVLVSPTVRQHAYRRMVTSAIPKLVIYGENDFATPQDRLVEWFEGLPEPKRILCIPDGEHFFRGQESVVAGHCIDFIAQSLNREACPA